MNMKKAKRLIAALIVCVMAFAMLPVSAFASAGYTKTGTFSIAALNVDGLPKKILGIGLNKDGPGKAGTKAISKKLNETGWDLVSIEEDFTYDRELRSSLTNYDHGTWRGPIVGVYSPTDGLNFLWNKNMSVSGETFVKWKKTYSTGIVNQGNGADGMIAKGYRFYQAEIADGVTVDVYVLHMDAECDPGDLAARDSQLRQLTTAIRSSGTRNPIIVMGDTNCRYTRDYVQAHFIDVINSDKRFDAVDPWVLFCHDGVAPKFGDDALVAKDHDGDYDYPECEIVDKMFIINNTDSDVYLSPDNYYVDTNFTADDGVTPLADHWPIVSQISYSKR